MKSLHPFVLMRFIIPIFLGFLADELSGLSFKQYYLYDETQLRDIWFYASMQTAIFSEAIQHCNAFPGAKMAVPTSQEQQKFFHYGGVLDTANTMNQQIYLGANDIAEDGLWTDADGKEITYQAWKRGEPDGGTQNCAVIITDRPTTGQYASWISEPCGSPMGYVCEVSVASLNSLNSPIDEGRIDRFACSTNACQITERQRTVSTSSAACASSCRLENRCGMFIYDAASQMCFLGRDDAAIITTDVNVSESLRCCFRLD